MVAAIRAHARRVMLLTVVAALAAMRSDASAAITFVKQVGANDSKATGTTIAVTVPAAGVATGNRLLVTFAMDPASGPISCGDTRGNVYAVDADVTNGSGTTGVRAVVLSAPVVTALAAGDLITITHPSVEARAMSVSEFSGLGARDRSATATGNSKTPSAC